MPRSWHILQAVLREKAGSAVALFRRAEVDTEKLCAGREKPASRSEDAANDGREWSEILDAALSEAQRVGHESAGTAHLILGILRHGRNESAALLRRFGIDLTHMRQLVATLRGEYRVGGHLDTSPRPALFSIAAEWQGARMLKIIERPEIEQMLITLLGCAANPHVLLVGPRGAGKRSILLSVTRRLANEFASPLGGALTALRVELLRLVGLRWQRALQKITDFVRELRNPGPFLLLVDDLDVFAGTGHWDDAAFFLRLMLAHASFPIIAVCETFTFERFLKHDAFAMERLTALSVAPPTGDEARRMLRAVRDHLELCHGIQVTDEAVDQAFISATGANEAEPFRLACRVLDQAAAYVRAGTAVGPTTSVTGLEESIGELERRKQEAVKAQDYQRAAQLRDEENQLREQKLMLALNGEAEHHKVVDAALILKTAESLVAGQGRLAWKSA